MKLTLFGIFYLLLYLYYIPTYWRIFNKLGRKGWEGIIPFYNHYIFFKEMWESRFFWIDIFSVIFSAIFATAYSFTDFDLCKDCKNFWKRNFFWCCIMFLSVCMLSDPCIWKSNANKNRLGDVSLRKNYLTEGRTV